MLKLDVELAGGGTFPAIAEQLKALDTVFSGVELIGRRNDGVDAKDIVESLMEHGRDFFTPDEQACDAVADACAKEVERRIQSAASLGRPDPKDNALAAAGLTAAMKAYMGVVVARIESQTTAGGGAPEQLTPAYAAWKQKKFGFQTPIGKATGQLLQSLVGGGAAAGKIELIRK